MKWITPAMLAIINFSSYNFLQKLTGEKINSYIALPFITLGVFFVSIISLVLNKTNGGGSFNFSKQGALYSVLLGILWAVGQILVFLAYKFNAPLSVYMPLTMGGVTVIITVLGIIMLGENINPIKIIGVFSLIIGFLLISKA